MSISSNNLRQNLSIYPKENDEDFPKKPMKKQMSLQVVNYEKEIFKKLNEGTVLNFITKSDRKDSINTNITESSKEMEYDLCMINKFDEYLNSSLSFISEFDLEEENENDNSFNSIDNDDSVEQIEITQKTGHKTPNDQDDEEHNTRLEKEWEDIQELLLNKNFS